MAIRAQPRRRSKQSSAIRSADVALFLLCCVSVITTGDGVHLKLNETLEDIEYNLEETLKLDKGKGCMIRRADPFSSEASRFDQRQPYVRLKCKKGSDWVKCYYSKCRVVKKIQNAVNDIKCEYRDIIYHNDNNYTIGPAKVLLGNESYELRWSDHVKVACNGTSLNRKDVKWAGIALGFRDVIPKKPPPGREVTFNVLIFGFDSTSRNGFIRLMPRSWRVLTEELGATVMEGYNILGEATPAALIPILTGHTELELPEVRKSQKDSQNVDVYPFIFYKLERDGYRTAFFEDMPGLGTFQYRLKGWSRQPVDHYLRPFFMEGAKDKKPYCVGSTPVHRLMMNITKQFMNLHGKRFVFTFIGELTHNDFNMLQAADKNTAAFLRTFKNHSEDTLLVVMADHGPRSMVNRGRLKTLEGKFEERQPLMALRLPTALVRERPSALAALRGNARALTTPHDLHATLLDVLGMTQHWNSYRVPGADLPRALTMLEPVSGATEMSRDILCVTEIPRNRSCSEAGIELQWCACVAWQNLSPADPLYHKTAYTLLDFINHKMTSCSSRTLQSVVWVRREMPNDQLLSYKSNYDSDGYTSAFGDPTNITEDRVQARIVLGPGHDYVEASLTYIVKKRTFLIDFNEIYTSNNSWICPSK